MFDLQKEPLLTLGQAARLVPSRRAKKTSGRTLWRWCVAGKGGVRLEHVRTPGGEYLTSAAAVARFLEAMTADVPIVRLSPRAGKSAGYREAVAELQARGMM